MPDALASGMSGARHFTELIVWHLGDQHRIEVFKLTGQTRLRVDLKLRSQIDDAADSVCRNVAEGFGGQSHREFARFVRIARRSLNEVQDGFRSAILKQYVTEDDLIVARRLQRRLYAAMASLLRYLDRDDADPSHPQAPFAPLAPFAPFAPLAPLAPLAILQRCPPRVG